MRFLPQRHKEAWRMTDTALLEHLEKITDRLGIELRYENLSQGLVRSPGGYCKVSGKSLILIHRRDSPRQKIRVLARSLSKLNLEGIFVPPAVRKVIESHNH
jgi:hypothetical protein